MFGISFLAPIALLGVLVLPALWWLLRVMPPAPRQVTLPTLHFLHDLPRLNLTSVRTPWWLLILRLLMLLCLILGIAGPYLANDKNVTYTAPNLHIIIDNGWTATPIWSDQIRITRQILADANRRGATIYLSSTAPDMGAASPFNLGPITPDAALKVVNALHPNPWPAKLDTPPTLPIKTDTAWVGDGYAHDNQDDYLEAARKAGAVTYFGPDILHGPIRLERDRNAPIGDIAVILSAIHPYDQDQIFQVVLKNENGGVITSVPMTLTAGSTRIRQTFDPKLWQGQRLTSIQLANQPSAAATIMLDGFLNRYNVAVIGKPLNDEGVTLTRPEYYLTRALEPYAKVDITDLASAIIGKYDVIITSDSLGLDDKQTAKLKEWIEAGGTLLRFAGSHMADDYNDTLLPIPLHRGARALSGLSNWATPPQLKPFAPTSPLAPLTPPENLGLKQQILAEPSVQNTSAIWAELNDGTPFISGRAMGKGTVVFVHTAADPSWSDMPLSGFFVSFLKLILMQSGQSHSGEQTAKLAGYAAPWLVMDAFGQIGPGIEGLQPLNINMDTLPPPDSLHPPGLYRQGALRVAYNLAENAQLPKPWTAPDSSIQQRYYQQTQSELDLRPWLIGIALMLFLIDGMVLLALQGLRFYKLAATAAIIFIVIPSVGHAADQSVDTLQTHLAYVLTNNREQDRQNQAGMAELTKMLLQRTSAKFGDPQAVNIARDDLSLYPLLYWSIDATTSLNDDDTIKRLKDYMAHGGVILLDAGDRSTTNPPIPTGPWRTMQTILQQLNSGAIQPIGDDHVLMKSFYLLGSVYRPERFGTIWLQRDAGNDKDGVSSVIVSSGNWSRYWAQPLGIGWENGRPNDAEIARRVGINFILYALTGNYKADQVHIPFLLERLQGGDAR